MIPFREAVKVWLRVALLSFGGPAGQIAVMHRIVVEEKRWISESRFLHALNYCMLLPGPEAQQLATYLGWLLHRNAGGLVAGGLFIVPGFLAILALSIVYALYQQTIWIDALFFGIKPAVLAIVVGAVIKIGQRALKTKTMVAIAATAFILIFFFAMPFPLLILAAALTGLLGHHLRTGAIDTHQTNPMADSTVEKEEDHHLPQAPPHPGRAVRTVCVWLSLWWIPVITLFLWGGADHIFTQTAFFFSKVAVVTFGGAYAVLAYIAQQAVEVYGWLQPGEMLDGLGMAETTPGPLIMVLQFVGFMGAFRAESGLNPVWAGILGSVLTTWVLFTPCFMFIFVGAPFVEALRAHRWLNAALSGVTAAIVGVILNLAIWFALNVWFGRVDAVPVAGIMRWWAPEWRSWNPGSIALSIFALVLYLYFKRGLFQALGTCVLLGAAWTLWQAG